MNRIKELRIEAGLTQSELAARLGLNQTAVGKYERGQLEPSIATLKALSTLFECSIDYLLYNTDDFGNITIQKEKSSVDLTADEKELMDIFKSLHHQHQVQILEYARYFAMRNSTIAPKKKA